MTLSHRLYTLGVSVCVCASLSACASPTALPTATPVITLVSQANPTNTPVPPSPAPTLVPTRAPLPTPTPKPAVVYTQLTQSECCVQPFLSSDGTKVMFLDKPRPDAQTGIYAVPLNAPLSEPVFINAHPGPYSRDMELGADIEAGQTVVKRFSDGKKWVIPNERRNVIFSPDNKYILWSLAEPVGNFDVRRSDIYLAASDGTGAKVIATRYGGGFQAWLNNGKQIILSGKLKRNDPATYFSLINIDDGSVRDLAEADRARGVVVSPNDAWMLYFVAQSRDEKKNGTYVISLKTPNAKPIYLEGYGSYRWCAPTKLLYIPLNISATSNELWLLDVEQNTRKNIIVSASDSQFKIANGDWVISLADKTAKIVYLNAHDRNIWLADLGDACN